MTGVSYFSYVSSILKFQTKELSGQLCVMQSIGMFSSKHIGVPAWYQQPPTNGYSKMSTSVSQSVNHHGCPNKLLLVLNGGAKVPKYICTWNSVHYYQQPLCITCYI